MLHQTVFEELLNTCVSDARIGIAINGETRGFGQRNHRPESGKEYDVIVRVHDPRFFTRVLALRNLGMGEAYMDGDFDMAQGSLEDFLSILMRSRIAEKVKSNLSLGLQVAWIEWTNAFRAKHQNVQRHYDIGDDLFEAMLDESMAYSCGYKRTPHDSLADLQRNKFDRICRKLKLTPGDRLLDIGCGFGGLLIHAATHYGASGLGVSNSQRHAIRAGDRVKQAGLDGRVEIYYQDFHRVRGTFTKVVSVGMMEHVPRREYRSYVGTIEEVLADGGMGLIHTIGCNRPKNDHDPFIQKYIFPGSGQPKLSEMAHQLEQHRLPILDVENIGRHYEPTLRGWVKRFRHARPRLQDAGYDERFLRMWEYYLAGCIAAAGSSNTSAVYHVLFTKGQSSLPFERV